jgi:hypothetical protein
MGMLVAIFQLPIVILNFLGFIVSGVWLLVIGQWRLVVAGLLISMFAPFILGLAILPGILIGAPGIHFANRGVTIGVYFFGFLSSVYIYALITAWCSGITFPFLHGAPSQAFWPLLIWSYGVATSPWSYMAQRDQSFAAFLAAFFAQVAFIVMMVSVAFGADLFSGFQVFSLVMAVGVFFHMRILAEAQRAGALQTDL